MQFGGFTKSQGDTVTFRETIALPDLERQGDWDPPTSSPRSSSDTHKSSSV